jgi:glycosyltransferase involved in cell wall biosynthesis
MPRPLRLTSVTHTFAKGSGHGRVNYEIVRRAADQGWKVTLLATNIAPELAGQDAVRWVPITWSKLPSQLARNLVFARRSSRWLDSHRTDRDVLHLNGFITWTAGDVNASHMVHGDWVRSPYHTSRVRRDFYGLYHRLNSVLNARWELEAYNKARVVVAVSERVKGQLVSIGVPAERIRVILNGVDPTEFRPAPANRSALGLPEGVPLGVFVGDIRSPLKNLDTILRALAGVPSMHLAVVGSTEGSPYPKLADALKLEDRVHFLGFRRDVAQVMQACDLFVFPSRSEACPLVMLEAMASGLPLLIASTVGGQEIVTSDCGVVVKDPNRADEIAQAMQTLVDAPARRRSMGEASRAIAERHTWGHMADEYLRVYTEVAHA